jgi:long-chain fatty acid transport protein
MKTLCSRLAVALVLCLVTAAPALAEGFALYEYSARGLALGGTTVARKPDPSAVAWNPALLTRLPGTQVMGGVTLVRPSGTMDMDLPDGSHYRAKLKDSVWTIPHLYFTHQINDDFTFGIGEFSRFGLGFEYPHDWPGRFNVYEVALTSTSINPSLAWKATDKLSLAGGVEIVYVNLDLKKRSLGPVYNAQGQVAGSMEVDANIQDASAWGIGANLGAHYQFSDQWAAGLTYRSPVRVHAKGDMEYSYVRNNGPAPDQAAEANYGNLFKDGTASSTVVLPESITGAIAFTPIPEVSLEVAATWTRWSRFRHLNIHIPDPLPDAQNNKFWSNAWRIGVGVEYSPTDWLDLRLGYTYDESPMSGEYADYLVPTNSRDIYSLGVGFKYNSWTMDIGYAYIAARQRTYRTNNETGVLDSKTNRGNHTQLLSLSIGYTF